MAGSDDAPAQGRHSSFGTCFLRVPAHVRWGVGSSPFLPLISSPDLFCLSPVCRGCWSSPS